MPESPTHALLVQRVISFVEVELGPLANLAVSEDSVRPIRGERPPRIGGYTPDVHACDVPTRRTVIGEAKTRADLENDHSRRQISAFLTHLAQTPGGTFVLAVPYVAGATARRLLAELCLPLGSRAPGYVVLDGTNRVGSKAC